MNICSLAVANLRTAPLTTATNVLLLGLGLAALLILFLVSRQVTEAVTRDAAGVDLVIGAKGSPVQLVLSSLYHADVPTGNIPLAEAQRWMDDIDVAMAIPLALGDTYRGHRIVGTTPDYIGLYNGHVATGRAWQAPMELVIRADVAARHGLKPGDSIVGAHGLSDLSEHHHDHPYEVVGVLARTGTVLDRVLVTGVESVWAVHGQAHHRHEGDDHEDDDHTDVAHEHEHEHKAHGQDADHDHADTDAAEADNAEITAVLIRYRSPLAATRLPMAIQRQSGLQAAAPPVELARVLRIVGAGLDGLRAFAVLLLVVAAFSVFVALYNALKARQVDIAVLRCLGATRFDVLCLLLIEGLLLAAGGILVGLLLGHGGVALAGQWLADSGSLRPDPWAFYPAEALLLATTIALSMLAALLPAMQAYRTDVADTLSRDA
ncbi:MAG: FtsX-like permease family protein [Gammaproteobacteria bacterium]